MHLPVYALIIAAFIPDRTVGPGIGLQGLVMFGLYVSGIVGALLAAIVLRRSVTKGGNGSFLMELPKYQMPLLRDVALGLWQRALIFLKRAGTIIFVTTVILWLLLSFPSRRPAVMCARSIIARRGGSRRCWSRCCARSVSITTSHWR